MKTETDIRQWEGKEAPPFSLPDQDGNIRSLSDIRGKKALLYFYPKDMTHGCTLEAQGFRDLEKEFAEKNIIVLGISGDSVASHKKFCEKESINFTLLSDKDKDTIRAYGVWKEKTLYGKKHMGVSRESFLIDEQGIILKHYRQVDPITHSEEVLRDVEKKNG